MRGAALSDWIERYNAARARVAAAGVPGVPLAARDRGLLHVDAAEAVDRGVEAVKTAAAWSSGWLLVAAVAWLWWESEQKKKNTNVIKVMVERGR